MSAKKIVLPVVQVLPKVEPILTAKELAEQIKLPVSTIYELTRKRATGRTPMPKLKAGKFLRFRMSDVVGWMERNAAA